MKCMVLISVGAHKGKYSLWGQAGLVGNFPSVVGSSDNPKAQVEWPAVFSTYLGIANKWEFNKSHGMGKYFSIMVFNSFDNKW